MGWGNCGVDDLGRPIGYAHDGICDHPDCDKEVSRGLVNVCGGMHGGGESGCGRYFCEEHLLYTGGCHFPICEFCESGGEVPVEQMLQKEVKRLVQLYKDIVKSAEACGVSFDELCEKYHELKEE